MARFLAICTQLILFVLCPIAVTGLQNLFGFGDSQITIGYVMIIFFFGLALQALRLLTNNLWTSIGFHLAYLEIARFIVYQKHSFLTYEELYPELGAVFLLFFMIILMCALLGTIALFIANKTKKKLKSA